MDGRTVAVLQNYSVINDTEQIFRYHLLKFSSTSTTKAAISCSSGVEYYTDSKEVSLSSELSLLLLRFGYVDHYYYFYN